MGRVKRHASPLWTLQRLCFEPDVAADPSDRGENRDPGTATEAFKIQLTEETRLENGPFGAREKSAMPLRGRVQPCVRQLMRRSWPLALMKSADQVPNHLNAHEALGLGGFARSPARPVCHHISPPLHSR